MATGYGYYIVLRISKNASADEIKRAYRKIAMKYHPDRNPRNTAAEELFKDATEAYEILSDPEKRAHYDRLGDQAFTPGNRGFGSGFHHAADIFEQVYW